MNLTDDQLEEFDEAFNFFDSDRDGLINEKELGIVFIQWHFTFFKLVYNLCNHCSVIFIENAFKGQ